MTNDIDRAQLVQSAALEHNLPNELAEALKGETSEEIEAHAKVLAKFASVEPADDPELSGGLDPLGDPDGEFDALAAARRARAQRW
ncbi:hypothetical protein GCM10023350_06390 [Nocardioides endophyticus]|uniref:DUF222 domain-containing protein n=1 Tax=Nocardioides endophyticus TaxID=1353775 RepID=A0ABP8YDC8_9ACTN